MGHLAEARVRAGAVDHDKLGIGLQPGHGHGQAAVIGVLAWLQGCTVQVRQVAIVRGWQVEIQFRAGGVAVLHETATASLAQVQVQYANRMAHTGQCRGHKNGDR